MLDNVLAPSITAPGLFISVNGGVINLGNNIGVARQTVAVPASATTFVFFDYAKLAIAQNATGFTAACIPIATVTTGPNGVLTLTDNRPDVQVPFSTSKSTTTLSSSQILNLFTTPVVLIPAPGVGKVIVPVWATLRLLKVTTAYTNLGGGLFAIQHGSQLPVVTFTTNVAATLDQYEWDLISGGSTGFGRTTIENQPLNAAFTLANPTAGDGIAKMSVFYTIEPTT